MATKQRYVEVLFELMVKDHDCEAEMGPFEESFFDKTVREAFKSLLETYSDCTVVMLSYVVTSIAVTIY